MTTLETLLIGVIWIITGVFICYKRHWYDYREEPEFICSLAIILAPFNLIITFLKFYLIGKWVEN